MKLKYLSMLMLGASLTGLTACNDFLDKVPESAVTPDAYFMAEADLAAYSINLYNFNTIPTGQYGLSVFADNNHTDDQVAMNSSTRWVPGQWLGKRF